MPAYRFSWDPFDDRTVDALGRSLGYSGQPAGAKAWLAARVARPNDAFLRDTKAVFERVWLPQHPAVAKAVVRELFELRLGPMGVLPEDVTGAVEYVMRCRNTSRLRAALLSRIISFGDRGGEDIDADADFLPSFGVLRPAGQRFVAHPPRAYQTEAWAALDAHLREADTNGIFKGVLVMPTGAGKTYTAVHWLMRRWLDAGKRVLWLAHREELLAQAASAFARCAGLASTRESLRLRQVSGRNCRFHQIDPADHIVCCSVQSLARAGDSARELLRSPDVFVVIDEAHHAPAKSYRDAIRQLEDCHTHHLLGLTATPTRTAERERPSLQRLFDHRRIYEVKMAKLVAQELLARPIPVRVETHVDAEAGMTDEDRQHLVAFQEPSEAMLARIGQSVQRNEVIVDHYVKNREKYGKTLVFVPDVASAAMLKERLEKALSGTGVEVEYLASYRPDLAEGQLAPARGEVLRAFADPRSGLDVLVNVEMLTEGVDLPETQAVFLARPTSSPILFRQMVGRGLRVTPTKKHAYVVSFDDQWSTFGDIYTTEQWLKEEEFEPEVPAKPVAPSEPEAASGAAAEAAEQLSWDEIRAVAQAIRQRLGSVDADVFEAVPHGMYVLEYETEEEPIHHVIHVYEHQESSWEELFRRLGWMNAAELEAVDVNALREDVFFDCADPLPSPLEVQLVVDRRKAGDALPEYLPLSTRAECDPRALAQLVEAQDLRRSEENELLRARFTPLARQIYGTEAAFRAAFDDAMRELQHPGERPPPKGVPVFDPPPSQRLKPGPHHDLAKLMDETLAKGAELLGRPLRHVGGLEWSRRLIKGWYGMAHFGASSGQGRIRINVLLDSPDFSAETMRFLLWHEFLHLHLLAGHTEEFRKLERLWPGYEVCDRELDALNERFGIQYW